MTDKVIMNGSNKKLLIGFYDQHGNLYTQIITDLDNLKNVTESILKQTWALRRANLRWEILKEFE